MRYNQMTKEITIQERGVMMSDYFGGTSGVMIPLTVDNKTTKKEVLEQLKQEISILFDHIEYTAEHHDVSYEVAMESINSELKEIADYIKNDHDKIAFPDLEFCFADMNDDQLDSEEFPVLIFTIEFNEV